MLKKNSIAALCAISLVVPIIANEQPNNEPVKKPEFGKFVGKTVASVLLGGLIGAAEGEICRRFERHMTAQLLKEEYYGTAFVTAMICWAVTTSAREGILNSIQKIMKKHNVDESFDLVKNSSRIASWLSYCMPGLFSVTMPNVLIFGQKMSNGWIKVG